STARGSPGARPRRRAPGSGRSRPRSGRARAARRTRALARARSPGPSRSVLADAVRAGERHEANGDRRPLDRVTLGVLLDQDEGLLVGRRADGADQAPARRELLDERRRDRRRAARDEDPVVGRVLRPAERAVAVLRADVVVAELREALGGAERELG